MKGDPHWKNLESGFSWECDSACCSLQSIGSSSCACVVDSVVEVTATSSEVVMGYG